jgi:hypothetical protein
MVPNTNPETASIEGREAMPSAEPRLRGDITRGKLQDYPLPSRLMSFGSRLRSDHRPATRAPLSFDLAEVATFRVE